MQQLHNPRAAATWLKSTVKGELHTDSRKVARGDGFIAWPGGIADGRQFVASVLQAGAAACLVEHEGAERYGFLDERIASYKDLKSATGPIADAYYDAPSKKIDVIAVTGTNGKTSTAWWIAQALSQTGSSQPIPCALVGTLGVGTPGNMVFNGLTTPDPVLLQQQFAKFIGAGFKACAIEASSIGIAECRLDATHIRTAVFTNFTQDHLDYHGTMQEYWAAKAQLFSWPGLELAVVNLDDPHGESLVAACEKNDVRVWGVSRCAHQKANIRAENVMYNELGMAFDVCEGTDSQSVQTQLVGDYNVSNLLEVIAVLRSKGISLADAAQRCSVLTPVPGRMEFINIKDCPLAVVDYAHTPDALEKALCALRLMTTLRGGRLWCVFGCGGDRDASKRSVMASTAERHADRIVITSDNSRGETTDEIIAQMVIGLAKPEQAKIQADRALAISSALAQASSLDVVLIAGKGHETTQEIAGNKVYFSDVEHAKTALNRRLVGATA